MTYALVSFAAAFFVVGVFRIVEFKAAGLSGLQRKILIPFHVLGCACFSAAIVLMAIDPTQHYKKWMTALFFSAVFTLFPVQIYLGIKRRIQISKQ